MKIVESVAELRETVKGLTRPLGLVPTMGYLHDGHMALVRTALAENNSTAVSIFVNPTQFGAGEDLVSYPRDLERDWRLLNAAGVDLLFAPQADEMYPAGFDTIVAVGGLSQRLEGVERPQHFTGVCTVVLKLCNLFRPERAYFGQKDAQQTLIIRQMARDLDTGLEIVTVPTVREPDGVALSSRNIYLRPHERQAIQVLPRALELARRNYDDGNRSADALRAIIEEALTVETLVTPCYISITDAETLEELTVMDRPTLIAVAVKVGRTRFLDNILLP